MYSYLATVERWIDGDTVWLTVDLGFRMTMRDSFRLLGIDTPERGQDGYHEATIRATELAPVGATVRIETAKAGKYGRWLANVFLQTGDYAERTVNDILVEEMLARPYDGGLR